MITGCVTIDLSDGSRDRQVLDVLCRIPSGAQVVVDIGARRYVTHDAALWLHEHDARLSIQVQGSDPQAVLAFVMAGRTGEWAIA